MQVTDTQRQLLEVCALRAGGNGLDWSLVAREASRPGGVARLLEGRITEQSSAAAAARPLLRRALRHLDEAAERVATELDTADALGARLVTVLDDAYPSNLRLIWNLPPFLFVLGADFRREDLRSVAVVGTRAASKEGLSAARRMSELLTERDVTVVSGLARGIDTVAHTAALDAGGRTIAVVGTGVSVTYPPENRQLAARITHSGTVVSQFWPSAGPAKWTFPRRNVVMSGIAQGTVVIEASNTSGARMQARLAHEHGKQVFLIRSLVTHHEWARSYVEAGKAIEVAEVDDVIRHLASPERITQVTTERQLSLDMIK